MWREHPTYFVANNIPANHKVAVILNVIWGKDFWSVVSLVAPQKPSEMTLAVHCDFRDRVEDSLRDRLVCGLRSSHIQRRLLSASDLTYAKAVKLATGGSRVLNCQFNGLQ